MILRLQMTVNMAYYLFFDTLGSSKLEQVRQIFSDGETEWTKTVDSSGLL